MAQRRWRTNQDVTNVAMTIAHIALQSESGTTSSQRLIIRTRSVKATLCMLEYTASYISKPALLKFVCYENDNNTDGQNN